MKKWNDLFRLHWIEYFTTLLLIFNGLVGYSQQSILHIVGDRGYYQGGIFEFGDTIVATYQGNTRLVSYDLGKNWKRESYPFGIYTGYEVFLNSKVGYRSQRNEISYTTDGGRDWSQLYKAEGDLSLIHVGVVNGRLIGLAALKVNGKKYDSDDISFANHDIFLGVLMYGRNDNWSIRKHPFLILPQNTTVSFSRGVISGNFDDQGNGILMLRNSFGLGHLSSYSHLFKVYNGYTIGQIPDDFPILIGGDCIAAYYEKGSLYSLFGFDYGQRLQLYKGMDMIKELKYDKLIFTPVSPFFDVEQTSFAPFKIYRLKEKKI